MTSKVKNRIPDKKECLELMDKYHMPPHIRQHSLVVCKIALSIARALNEAGESLNIAEIEAASLLHDITKAESFGTGADHAKTAAQLLKGLGYGRIAEIVREHVGPQNSAKATTEEEVVCYADKRVLHDRVVSIEERFDCLKERYGKDEKAVHLINAMGEKIKGIERKILKKANCEASDIISRHSQVV